MALAVLIGSGVQVFGMTVITMGNCFFCCLFVLLTLSIFFIGTVFAVLGFLSPSQRGMLVTAFLVLFVVMG